MIASVVFTFMGMPFIGALIGSAISTFSNGGSFADFAIGFGVGLVAGYVGGTIAGKIGTFLNMDKAGLGLAALRGGLSGSIAGAGAAAIYDQDIGKGALFGLGLGVTLGSIFWAKNNYTTNRFLKENVKWDPSVSEADKATITQGIKEAGQSPQGQREIGRIRAENRTLTLHTTTDPGGYVPTSSPNDIYINPDIEVTRTYNAPHYNQLKTMDMGTLILHEMGHSLGFSDYAGEPPNTKALNVSYNENPYRAWIGTPARTGYTREGDVPFKQWLHQY